MSIACPLHICHFTLIFLNIEIIFFVNLLQIVKPLVVVPVDNLGAEYADAQIKAGTANAPAKGTLSGYRNWFMYIGTDWTTAADSAFIRGNAAVQGSGKNAATKKEVSIPAGTNR